MLKIKRLLCVVGFHQWKWTLLMVDQYRTENALMDIPDRAICVNCNKKYQDIC